MPRIVFKLLIIIIYLFISYEIQLKLSIKKLVLTFDHCLTYLSVVSDVDRPSSLVRIKFCKMERLTIIQIKLYLLVTNFFSLTLTDL